MAASNPKEFTSRTIEYDEDEEEMDDWVTQGITRLVGTIIFEQ